MNAKEGHHIIWMKYGLMRGNASDFQRNVGNKEEGNKDGKYGNVETSKAIDSLLCEIFPWRFLFLGTLLPKKGKSFNSTGKIETVVHSILT